MDVFKFCSCFQSVPLTLRRCERAPRKGGTKEVGGKVREGGAPKLSGRSSESWCPTWGEPRWGEDWEAALSMEAILMQWLWLGNWPGFKEERQYCRWEACINHLRNFVVRRNRDTKQWVRGESMPMFISFCVPFSRKSSCLFFFFNCRVMIQERGKRSGVSGME